MGFFRDEERQLIRDHAFSIDCLRMQLTQQGNGRTTYAGGGQIRQDPDGVLELVLYDTVARLDLTDVLRSRPVGELLADEEFFRLEAVDVHGNVWNAEWIHINTSSNAGHPGVIVRGQLSELVTASSLPPSAAGFLAFAPAAVRLPLNRVTKTVTERDGRESRGSRMDTWATELQPLGSLRVRKLDTGVDVEFSSAGRTLPDAFESRLTEALTFVLGQPIGWLEYQIAESGTLRRVVRSAPRQHGQPRLQSPVRNTSLQAEPGVLLGKFLNYLVATPPPPDRHHPLAVSIARVLRASASDIEDEILVLAVEVERLARDHYSHKAPISESLRTAIANARVEIEKLDVEIAGRLLGTLKGYLDPSALSILRALQQEGVLRDAHLRAWRKARNREAHGGRSSAGLEKLAAEANFVYQALLLIVFCLVGFDGQFSDHTIAGWPLTSQPRVQGVPASGGASEETDEQSGGAG